jgi:hypothetical protein
MAKHDPVETYAVEAYARVVEALRSDSAHRPGAQFGSRGLKVNDKMYAMLAKGVFVVKLPEARVNALVEDGRGARFDPGHGRLQKEWLAVAGDRLDWLAIAKEARAFVGGAKTKAAAKPTKTVKAPAKAAATPKKTVKAAPAKTARPTSRAR